MGKLILYGIEASPPVRAVMLTLDALELEYELEEVDFFKGEQISPEFLKINPQHTVPTLGDNGQFIWDSHAICAYLVRKYAKNDALYPKDFYQRAVVDQRLHFDTGVLFPSLRNITFAVFVKKETNIPQEKINAIYDAYNFLEAFLKHDYLAGGSLTIADLSAVATVSSLVSLAPIDPSKTPKLVTWINRLSKLTYYKKANAKGAEIFTQLFNAAKGKK